MPTVYFAPVGNGQVFLAANALPANGGFINTYLAGSTTPAATYTTSAGTVVNSNPIVLTPAGLAPNEIWLIAGTAYKFVVTDILSTQIGPTYDNLTGIGDSLFTQDGTGAVTTTASAKAKQIVSVFDFLTAAQIADVQANTFTLDCTAGIQNAIAFVSLIGGTLLFPAGTYRTSAALTLSNTVTLQGYGRSCTFIKNSSTTNIITIGDGIINPRYCSVRDMGFTYSGAQTTSSVIQVRNAHGIELENLVLNAPFFTGIELDGGSLQFEYRVRDVEINGATNDGIQIGADGTLTQEIFLTDLDIFTAAANGVHMFGAVSAVYCKNVSIGACNKGFLIGLPAVGQKVQSLFFTDCLADTCKDVGWHFADNGAATIADVNMTACWGSSNGTVTNAGGLLFDLSFASSKGFEVNGGRFINNKGYGIEILGGQKININNAQVLNNSQQGSGSSHGIIVGANVTDFSIIGGSSGLGTVGGVNNQGYGIVINGGTSNHYAIIGVDVTGNVTAGISDGGSGADKFIYGNAGFTTSNSGTAQIAAGTASIAVNHGLNATPATTDIQVTANSNITAATNFWVDTVGATSFTIRANVNVTGNSNFTWWARTKGA